MADTEKSPAALLDELARLHPQARRKLARILIGPNLGVSRATLYRYLADEAA